MKWILASALLAALPHWVPTTAASPANDEIKAGVQAFVVTGGDHKDGVYTIRLDTDDESHAQGGVVVLTGDDDHGDHQVRKVVRLKTDVQGIAEDRGWLGISVGEVPDSVAAHVATEGTGVIILNVVEDSPADVAGLLAHDIILAIEGEDVEGDVGRTAKLIGTHKPGEQIEIKVLRSGQENALKAELRSWPDRESLEWKFDVEPLAEVEEEIKTRGKLMFRDAGGEWVFKDLGDLSKLDVLKDLPDNIRAVIPQSGSKSMQVFVEGGEKTVSTRIQHDGDTLVVEQEGDGPITVRRQDKDGPETIHTYADEEELREADEEAYKAYQDAGEAVTVKIDLDGLETIEEDFDVDFNVDEWEDQLGDWRAHMNEALSQANEARQQAMEQLEEIMEQLKSGKQSPLGPHFDALPFGLDDEGGKLEKFFAPGLVHIGKPRHSFELREDGKIEVRIRKGDSELVQLYTNDADLAERNPELYSKYRELMSVEE